MATTVCTSGYTPTLITLDLAIPFVDNDYSNTTSVLATFDIIWLDTCVIHRHRKDFLIEGGLYSLKLHIG